MNGQYVWITEQQGAQCELSNPGHKSCKHGGRSGKTRNAHACPRLAGTDTGGTAGMHTSTATCTASELQTRQDTTKRPSLAIVDVCACGTAHTRSLRGRVTQGRHQLSVTHALPS